MYCGEPYIDYYFNELALLARFSRKRVVPSEIQTRVGTFCLQCMELTNGANDFSNNMASVDKNMKSAISSRRNGK